MVGDDNIEAFQVKRDVEGDGADILIIEGINIRWEAEVSAVDIRFLIEVDLAHGAEEMGADDRLEFGMEVGEFMREWRGEI